jgi:hypothetical protein
MTKRRFKAVIEYTYDTDKFGSTSLADERYALKEGLGAMEYHTFKVTEVKPKRTRKGE